jgi:hypothetical protein
MLTIKRNVKRYGPFNNGRKRSLDALPDEFLVDLTLEQAKDLAIEMSFSEPGCDDCYYVKEDPEMQ